MNVTLRAYERWARHYPATAHNPLMRAEERAMLARWPRLAGLPALDLACGTGRYSRHLGAGGAEPVLAVDFCMPMLERGARLNPVCASMDCLPFRDAQFAAVISGLAVGHAPRLDIWMQEVARVLRPGGTLLYSDFHPDAARAGLPRNFRDSDGEMVEVPHHRHDVAVHRAAAAAHGLRVDSLDEVRAGIELCERFHGCDEFYRRWHGLALVLVVQATRVAPATNSSAP